MDDEDSDDAAVPADSDAFAFARFAEDILGGVDDTLAPVVPGGVAAETDGARARRVVDFGTSRRASGRARPRRVTVGVYRLFFCDGSVGFMERRIRVKIKTAGI